MPQMCSTQIPIQGRNHFWLCMSWCSFLGHNSLAQVRTPMFYMVSQGKHSGHVELSVKEE